MQNGLFLLFLYSQNDGYCEKKVCVYVCVKCDSVKRKHNKGRLLFLLLQNTENLKSDLFNFCCFGLIFPIAECVCLQRIVNNYLLNSCCRLTFISLHNLPYDYCLMCVCLFVLLLSSFYRFLLARNSLFLISYRFSFCFASFLFRSMWFYFLIVTLHLFYPRQLFTERTGRCTFVSHPFTSPNQRKKESHRVKFDHKNTQKQTFQPELQDKHLHE